MKFLKPFLLLFCLCFFMACSSDGANTTSSANSTAGKVSYKDLKSEQVDGKTILFQDGKPFNGIAFSTYENGKNFVEQEYIDGKKEGVYGTWYPSGGPKTSGKVLGGKEEGEIKEWYQNGQQKYLWIFKNGMKDGQWLSWYESGQAWTQRDFSNNVLNGKVLVWDEDGVLGKEYTYVRGSLVDQIMHFEEGEQ